ncbi:MAG TPA: ABC transporter substrate-binding protein [Alphaproteobacteria bacterium]|nr:ABC transporter substrate-binding protein [Alphaproteobacteria bacterium]
MRFRTLASSLALTAALFGWALADADPAGAQSQGTTLTGAFDVGPGGFQGNFNPLAATAGFTWLSLYYEPLVIYDGKLENVVGALASGYEVNAEQTEYTFQLEEATWHDGEPFTSEDVRFTIALAKDGASGSVFAARLGSIAEVATPDERTVVLKLSEPDAGLIDTLTKLMILPEHALSEIPVDGLARNEWWSQTPIGTGPFKFTRYETDQYVELAANPDYRRGEPEIDRVINRYFENTAAAVAALRSGEIAISYVESNDVGSFEGNDAFRVIEGNSFVVNYIGFNQEVPLWKDVRVRQAVMHAIDRNAIIESLYGGAATPANCGYVADHLVPSDIEPYAYDPEKARQLLEEAGWDEINGDDPITLLTYYNTPLATNVLAAVQAMLAQVGINVVPKAVDVPTYNATIYAQEPDWSQFPLVYAGLQNGPDPSALNIGLNEAQIPPAGSNFLRIRMPEVTQAFDAALDETDASKSAERYEEVCRAMNAQLPWATMWVANRYGVVSNDLQNFVWLPAPGGGPYEAHPEEWTITE